MDQVANIHGRQSLLACPDPYACLKCQKGFADRDSLKKHQKTDCLSVPHVCPHCHKDYCSEGNLKRHVSTVHNGIRPFICPVCGNMFTQKGHMTAHLRKLHSEDKTAFAAEAGGKGSSTRDIKDRPFACEVCDQRFTAKGNLKRHMLKHTDYKPFCCQVCGQGFSQKVHKINHEEKKHDIVRPPPRPSPPRAKTEVKVEFMDVPAETFYAHEETNSMDSGIFSVSSSTPYEMPYNNEGYMVSSTCSYDMSSASSYEVPYADDQPLLPVDELVPTGSDWEVDMLQQACFDLGLMEDQPYSVKDMDLVSYPLPPPAGFNEADETPYVTVDPVVMVAPPAPAAPPAPVVVKQQQPPPAVQFIGAPSLAYGCNRCLASYADVKQLQKHLREVHDYQQARDKKGNDRKGNPADEVYRCRLCGRTFEWAQSMTRHMRTHTGERPYGCRASPALGPVCNGRWIHLESEKRHRKACLEASVQVNAVSSSRHSPAHHAVSSTWPSPSHHAISGKWPSPAYHAASSHPNGLKTIIDCGETKPVLFDLNTNQPTVVNH